MVKQNRKSNKPDDAVAAPSAAKPRPTTTTTHGYDVSEMVAMQQKAIRGGPAYLYDALFAAIERDVNGQGRAAFATNFVAACEEIGLAQPTAVLNLLIRYNQWLKLLRIALGTSTTSRSFTVPTARALLVSATALLCRSAKGRLVAHAALASLNRPLDQIAGFTLDEFRTNFLLDEDDPELAATATWARALGPPSCLPPSSVWNKAAPDGRVATSKRGNRKQHTRARPDAGDGDGDGDDSAGKDAGGGEDGVHDQHERAEEDEEEEEEEKDKEQAHDNEEEEEEEEKGEADARAGGGRSDHDGAHGGDGRAKRSKGKGATVASKASSKSGAQRTGAMMLDAERVVTMFVTFLRDTADLWDNVAERRERARQQGMAAGQFVNDKHRKKETRALYLEGMLLALAQMIYAIDTVEGRRMPKGAGKPQQMVKALEQRPKWAEMWARIAGKAEALCARPCTWVFESLFGIASRAGASPHLPVVLLTLLELMAQKLGNDRTCYLMAVLITVRARVIGDWSLPRVSTDDMCRESVIADALALYDECAPDSDDCRDPDAIAARRKLTVAPRYLDRTTMRGKGRDTLPLLQRWAEANRIDISNWTPDEIAKSHGPGVRLARDRSEGMPTYTSFAMDVSPDTASVAAPTDGAGHSTDAGPQGAGAGAGAGAGEKPDARDRHADDDPYAADALEICLQEEERLGHDKARIEPLAMRRYADWLRDFGMPSTGVQQAESVSGARSLSSAADDDADHTPAPVCAPAEPREAAAARVPARARKQPNAKASSSAKSSRREPPVAKEGARGVHAVHAEQHGGGADAGKHPSGAPATHPKGDQRSAGHDGRTQPQTAAAPLRSGQTLRITNICYQVVLVDDEQDGRGDKDKEAAVFTLYASPCSVAATADMAQTALLMAGMPRSGGGGPAVVAGSVALDKKKKKKKASKRSPAPHDKHENADEIDDADGVQPAGARTRPPPSNKRKRAQSSTPLPRRRARPSGSAMRKPENGDGAAAESGEDDGAVYQGDAGDSSNHAKKSRKLGDKQQASRHKSVRRARGGETSTAPTDADAAGKTRARRASGKKKSSRATRNRRTAAATALADERRQSAVLASAYAVRADDDDEDDDDGLVAVRRGRPPPSGLDAVGAGIDMQPDDGEYDEDDQAADAGVDHPMPDNDAEDDYMAMDDDQDTRESADAARVPLEHEAAAQDADADDNGGGDGEHACVDMDPPDQAAQSTEDADEAASLA